DAEPIRIIQGPKTRLISPHSLTLDPANKELIVADVGAREVMVFPWDAEGDAAPIRVIGGPKAQLSFVVGASLGSGRDVLIGPGSSGVWDIDDQGDVPPKAIIRGSLSQIVHPSGLYIHRARGEVIATDSVRNGVFTFYVPEFFGRVPTPDQTRAR